MDLESLLIGRTLGGRYEVREVIGRGGMSVVYAALDLRLQRPIALKIVSVPGSLEPEDRLRLRERLKREAGAAARIPPHPNVVQIYDYGTDGELDLDFIAMELLRGSDLKRVLRTRRLPPAEARRVLVEAARGLAAGHRAGLVHRDVKPANIFLLGDADIEGVKILDFGIAKALEPSDEDDLTRGEQSPHSPAYASPEQVRGEAVVTPASDVYQLGLVAYEVLAGERPYTPAERARFGVEAGPLPVRGRWAEIDDGIRRAVETALAADPVRRYPDAAAFAAALVSDPKPDDATVLISSPAAEDATVLLDAEREVRGAAAAGSAALATAEPAEPFAASAAPVAEKSRAGRRPPDSRPLLSPFRLAGAALVILFLFVLARGVLRTVRGDADAPITLPNVEELHEEFRSLLFDAFRHLEESRSAEEGEEAAVAVQAAIHEMFRSWVSGDLDAHLAMYADDVEFRGPQRGSLDRIRREREETLRLYPDREITLAGIAIEFVERGRARALVDRRWRFTGEETWTGASREELVLRREGNAWRIVAESELERFEESRRKS